MQLLTLCCTFVWKVQHLVQVTWCEWRQSWCNCYRCCIDISLSSCIIFWSNLLYSLPWVVPAARDMSCVMICPYCIKASVHLGSGALASGKRTALICRGLVSLWPVTDTGGAWTPVNKISVWACDQQNESLFLWHVSLHSQYLRP